ncbi:DUF1569 domain-containing protein [Aestuariivivens marinum]|uniref:DUF1569 domain-containing protein n=1 Tax=Aestuariivivens marinum TaxID=2913555 RepID=UPI001F5601C9|nr:DUF1569 domain-containing protein [Aestuariivivens marinum]
MKILNRLLAQVESYIPYKDQENLLVSKATVGWQLDHTLKVFNTVSLTLKNSNPKDYKKQFNYWRILLFPLGYIPRGKAKAPKLVLPPEVITKENLKAQLEIAKNHTDVLKTLPNHAYFKHFIFGVLTKKQTLRFLEMHTKHHLKIVRDILEN